MNQNIYLKFVIVFVYHGLTAVFPLLTALYAHNPYYLILYPALAALWKVLESYLQSKNLIGGGNWH